MGKIALIRHGHSSFNAGAASGERVRGWDSVSLDAQGREEAADVARLIAKSYKVGRVFTSDLPRAQETSEFIADLTGASISPSQDLRTWNLGCLTGKLVSACMADLQFYDANPNAVPKDGESKAHFIDRYGRDLYELLDEVRKSKWDAVLTTHGRNIQVTPSVLAGEPCDTPYQHLPSTGMLGEIKPAGGKRWKLVVFDRELREIIQP